MEMIINKLIEFCEEEEYTHRIRCKQYDAASGFTRTGNKDIRTACAFSEEIKMNYYQQMINTMRKYKKIEEILDQLIDSKIRTYDAVIEIEDIVYGQAEVENGNDD